MLFYMTGFRGASLEDLTALQTTVARANGKALDAAVHLAGMVGGSWPVHGPAGNNLRNDIRALGPRLENSAERLGRMVIKIGDEIDQQRNASKADGTGGNIHLAQVPMPPGLGDPLDEVRRNARAREIVQNVLGLNFDEWNPRLGFAHNERFVRAVYDYYAGLFADRPQLQWAGMAKLAGVVVYAGFHDMQSARALLLRLGQTPGPTPLQRLILDQLGRLSDAQLAHFERQFLEMHRAVFLDLAFQHEAYRRDGIRGIEELARNGELPPRLLDVWRMIDSGNPATVAEGNRMLLLREQSRVLQPHYDHIMRSPVGQVFTGVLSMTTQSPIPGGQPFSQHGGNIGRFDDRWDWIEQDMLPRYQRLLTQDPTGAARLIGTPLEEAAARYRTFPRIPPPAPIPIPIPIPR